MDTYLLPSHQKETKHGNKLAPYAFYHCAFASNAPQVLLHWHEEAEFTIIREGSATYQIDQHTFRVNEGDLLFIAPNTLHSIYLDTGKPMVSDTLVFHLDLLGYSIMDQCTISYLRPFYNGSLKLCPRIESAHPAYQQLFHCVDSALCCVVEQPQYYELLLKEELHHFFYLLFKNNCLTETNISKSTALHIDKVKQALLYVQENYRESITVNQLARLCNFSEVHFMNFFKKAVGIPCMEYIIQLRLKIAADLIATTSHSISEIALDSGFNNLSNFNRKFKTHYHLTPSEYRKEVFQAFK